jgi:hypothetical protein
LSGSVFWLIMTSGVLWAATHQITSANQLDAAFWSAVQDNDVIVLHGDFAMSTMPTLTAKSVMFKSADGVSRTMTMANNPLVWANALNSPGNTITLDGVVLTGGTGGTNKSLGGAMQTTSGSAPVQAYPFMTIQMVNGAEINGNTVSGTNSGAYPYAAYFRAMGGGLAVHNANFGGSVTMWPKPQVRTRQ